MLHEEQETQTLPSTSDLSSPQEEATPKTWQLPLDWRDVLTCLLLVVILVGGYKLRSVGRNWDDYTHLHPDERFLTDVASRVGNSALNLSAAEQVTQKATCDLRYPAPTESDLEGLSTEEREYRISRTGRGGYFDADCSDLNPNNIGFGLYVYGEYPLFTTRLSAEVITETDYNQCVQQADGDETKLFECQTNKRFSPWISYNGVHLVGRMMSSVADTLTILLVFLIAFKLFGRPQALLAAGLYAFAAFPIQQSHFWTVDTFTTTWVTLSIYAGVCVLNNDAARPARFSPLAWITAALGVWILELDRLAQPSITPLILYGVVFTLVGIAASLDEQWKNISTIAAGLIGFAILLAGYQQKEITDLGLVAATVGMLLLAAFIHLGLNRLAAYGGTWIWLMVGFSLWVYDGLAHYRVPSLMPLVIYAVIFTVGGLLGSVLYQAQSRRDTVFWGLLLGVPLVIWAVIDALAGAISWEGMLWSLLLTGLLSTSIAYGYRDYAAFGVAFGAALASRVNVAPLVGVLLLAVLIRSLPLLDSGLHRVQRYILASRALGGLMLAGVMTLLFFRLLQPHAFEGAYDLPLVGNLGVIPAGFNQGWLEDIGEAQRLVSGQADIPPNHQWANRIPWLFPGQNIVIYGLGIVLGLTAVAGLIWALWIIVRAQKQWTRLALPAVWVTVYFGWLGANWVTTMRYFFLLYASLALLAAWLLVEVITRAWQAYQTRPTFVRRLALAGANLLMIFVLVYTMLYGYGMTSIYRHVLTRTAASLWFQENVPGDLGVWVQREDGSYALQNLGISLVSTPATTVLLDQGQSIAVPLTVPTDVTIQSINIHRLTDRDRNGDNEIISVRIQQRDPSQLLPSLLAERLIDANVDEGFSDFGGEYTVRFDDDPANPVLLSAQTDAISPVTYEVEIKAIKGNIAVSRNVSDNILPTNPDHMTLYATNSDGDPFVTTLKLDDATAETPPYTYFMPSQRGQLLFTATATGTVSQVEIPHLADPLDDSDDETLRLEIASPDGTISYGGVTGNFLTSTRDPMGPGAVVHLDPPLQVKENANYAVSVVSSAPLMMMGSVVATEGPWDDPMPYKVCPLPNGEQVTPDTASGYSNPACIGIELYSAHYYGLELYLAAEDDDLKRETMQKGLDEADYLTIASNRFYDSLSRIPYRWPMTMAYYKALFSGDLGFQLVYTWQSYPRIDALGLEWKDEVLPTDDLPSWMNEFEAEEAFHVYDHPVVFVFKKTDAYSPQNTQQVLSTSTRQYKEAFGGFVADELPVNRNVQIAPTASLAPTGLMLTDSSREAQHANTWSDLYDVKSLLNRNQWAAAAAWWLLMILLGWLVYPMLYAIFPALPDRGFAAAKLIGLLLVAWSAWMGASLHLYTWNQRGVILCAALVLLISLAFLLPRRRDFITYVKGRWGYFLAVECLSLLLYGLFLYVRYRNPDLWHNAFGGEKPMDFAYFNAVLRSRVFPPLDPWFAGGFINYYYWGFVLVGTPVKFLGIEPAIAYNLAIPTMFSLTGMGAFAVAYNVTASKDLFPKTRMPVANPWLAGIAALMLTAVVGNLDTVRVFTTEVAKLGGWSATYDLTSERRDDLLNEFRAENGRDPNQEELLDIEDKAANPPFYIKVQHSVTRWGDMAEGFSQGIRRLSEGDDFTMPTHRWYWAPTRIIAELPDGKGYNAINEMPYFTFLYGDLHAHMMAMSLMLLAMLWVAAEILAAGRGLRTTPAAIGSLFLGGLTVGVLRATNTWDFPTYLILGAAGLTFAAWLSQKRRMTAHELPQPSAYQELLDYMDLRRSIRLWWLIFAFPTGIMLHGLVWLLHWRAYTSNLNQGLIPQQCQQISQLGLPAGVTMPTICEGKIEPVWHLTESLMWGIGMLALTVGFYWLLLVLLGARFDRRAFLGWLGRVGAFVVTTIVVVAPYTYWNVGEAGLKPWEFDRTPLWAYLDIHGLFLFILLSWLIWNTGRLLKRYTVADLYGLGLPTFMLLAAIPLTLLATLVIGLFIVPVMLVTLPMILWGSGLFLMPGTSRMERFIYALMILALGLTTGVELVVLNVDIGRQNMVFKFYMQAWLLFAVSSGVALAWLLGAAPKWQPSWRALWQLTLALLLSVTMMYPIMATQARWLDRFDQTRTGNTLDGQAYMQYAVYGDNAVWYNLRGDYNMIQWINQNIKGTPTIIEAQTVEYKWGSRIAINTGLPTVIGWNWHQRQQRNVLSLNQLVWNRSNNVTAFYSSPSIETAWNLIRFYGIEYIILGTQEHITYNDLQQDGHDGPLQAGLSVGLAKFDRMVDLGLLEVVYQSPSCVTGTALSAEECPPQNILMDKIYRVVPGAVYELPQQVGG